MSGGGGDSDSVYILPRGCYTNLSYLVVNAHK